MFSIGEDDYNSKSAKHKIKLRAAWEKFYTPLQLSRSKFLSKVSERVKKGKMPSEIIKK